MEKSDACECHSHVILVASHDDMIVTDGSAGLSDILNAALSSSLDVITEGEECIGTEAYVEVLLEPLLLLFLCKYFGLNLEELLPSALGKNVVVLIGDIDIDSVVSVRSSDTVYELKSHDLGVLTEPPDICLVTCKSCAVDTGLLSCTDTDSLTGLYVAMGAGT